MGESRSLGSEARLPQCLGGAAEAPRKKRKRKKRKCLEDVAGATVQEVQTQGQPWSPKSRTKGQAELPAYPGKEEGTQLQVNGRPVGHVLDGHLVSGRKRRRTGVEGLTKEVGPPQDPPRHR